MASLDAAKRQQAQIGKASVSTLAGTLDASFDLGTGASDLSDMDLAYAGPEADNLKLEFQDPVLADLLGNRFMFGLAPKRVDTAAITAPDGRVLPRPYFETRMKFIDQKQFYGSGYFFERLGYKPQSGTHVSGDNYFDTQWILRERARLLGGVEGRVGSGNAEAVKALMDNGAEQAARLGLEVGKALTQEQIARLDKDMVWYSWANIKGTKVLMPRVYLASASKQAADEMRKKGGAVMASAGKVGIDTNGADVAVNNAASWAARSTSTPAAKKPSRRWPRAMRCWRNWARSWSRP